MRILILKFLHFNFNTKHKYLYITVRYIKLHTKHTENGKFFKSIFRVEYDVINSILNNSTQRTTTTTAIENNKKQTRKGYCESTC